MGCETQNTPADETSSASVRASALVGAQHRCVVENDERAHSRTTVERQPASGTQGSVAMTKGSMRDPNTLTYETGGPPSLSALAFEPHTKSLFLQAGLEPGMRVLDAWSGAGEVAFIAREIVGPYGHVTGFDHSPAPVAYASQRAAARGLKNVEFVQADIANLPFGRDFDAIVGRVVLIYRSDPAGDLKALLRCLRPGGLVVFQETDLLTGKTVPAAPVIDKIRDWMLDAFAQAGIEMEMGHKLYQTFKAAGLPAPQMEIDGFIGGVEDISPALFANVVRMLVPHLEALGVATAEEIEVHTLEQRMRAELARTGGVMSTPLLIGAWARLPA
jgi:ubiquinone/menaquinone biosynthesis C-methylase UbiE